MKVLELAHGYELSLCEGVVRTDDEMRDMGLRMELSGSILRGTGNHISLEYISLGDPMVVEIMGYKRSDGSINPRKAYSFLGCSSKAVEVTDEEWAELIRRNEKGKAEKEEKGRQELIEQYRRVIQKAERQPTIPTKEEAERMRKQWIDLHNEGGDGFVPWIVDVDAYNAAKAELEKMTK